VGHSSDAKIKLNDLTSKHKHTQAQAPLLTCQNRIEIK